MAKYQGYVVGESILLGGVKEHKSSWFSRKSDAKSWLQTIKEGNKRAGRKMVRSGIRTKK